jgi:hypothetical protein
MSTESPPTKSAVERYFDTLRSMDPDDELLRRIERLEREAAAQRTGDGPTPSGRYSR